MAGGEAEPDLGDVLVDVPADTAQARIVWPNFPLALRPLTAEGWCCIIPTG